MDTPRNSSSDDSSVPIQPGAVKIYFVCGDERIEIKPSPAEHIMVEKQQPAAMESLTQHRCGGAVLPTDVVDSVFMDECHMCDQCGAFAPRHESVPDGIDVATNAAAWDAGEPRSPTAAKTRR